MKEKKLQTTTFRTYELAVQFYRESRDLALPRHLRDQIDRASSSVVLNLAEGSAKASRKNRARWCPGMPGHPPDRATPRSNPGPGRSKHVPPLCRVAMLMAVADRSSLVAAPGILGPRANQFPKRTSRSWDFFQELPPRRVPQNVERHRNCAIPRHPLTTTRTHSTGIHLAFIPPEDCSATAVPFSRERSAAPVSRRSGFGFMPPQECLGAHTVVALARFGRSPALRLGFTCRSLAFMGSHFGG